MARRDDGMPETRSVSVRKIDNGFIAEHYASGPDGYTRKEVFHPTRPALEFSPQEQANRQGRNAPQNALAVAARHIDRPRRG